MAGSRPACLVDNWWRPDRPPAREQARVGARNPFPPSPLSRTRRLIDGLYTRGKKIDRSRSSAVVVAAAATADAAATNDSGGPNGRPDDCFASVNKYPLLAIFIGPRGGKRDRRASRVDKGRPNENYARADRISATYEDHIHRCFCCGCWHT
jgi:hypothetical protein